MKQSLKQFLHTKLFSPQGERLGVRSNFGRLFISLILILSVASCSDVWDEHYNSESLNKSDLNLYQYISQDSSLTVFSKMLQITGYDSILSQSQSFTVWAPTNASLKNVSLTDYTQVRNIVQNHITRFSYPTSSLGGLSKVLRMFDKKLLLFEQAAGGYTFAGKPVVKSDLAMKNGIVHILGEYAPYINSIWEYINEAQGIDSLRTFLNSLTIKTYDPIASFQDGVFVDSVFKPANALLTNLAALDVEDSIYTAILPNNAAWTDAYTRIVPFYKFLPAEGGTVAQMAYAKNRLVRDLFFRTKLTFPITATSLKSAFGHTLTDPATLFTSASNVQLSNGTACVTGKLMHKPTESWFDTIRVEAENASFRTGDKLNYEQYVYSGIGSGLSVSGGRYLYLKDVASSGYIQPYATFEIRNTLSAKYNIYCVFAPSSLIATSDVRPNKVKFYLSYIDATGKQVTNAAIDANNLVTSYTGASTTKFPSTGAGTFTTTPLVMKKMLVAKNVVFPYCNLITSINSTSNRSPVTLTVQNAASFTEKDSFTRNLMIDCIILEPVF